MNTSTPSAGARQAPKYPKLSLSCNDFRRAVADTMVLSPDVQIDEELRLAARAVECMGRLTDEDIHIGIIDHLESFGGHVEAVRHQLNERRAALHQIGDGYFQAEGWAAKRAERLLAEWFPDGERNNFNDNWMVHSPEPHPYEAMLSVNVKSCVWHLHSEILSSDIHDAGLVKLWAFFTGCELHEAVSFWHEYISKHEVA